MRNLLLILMGLFLIGCVTPDYTHYTPSTTYRHYNSRGMYIGKSECNKYRCRSYDKRGKYLGYTK